MNIPLLVLLLASICTMVAIAAFTYEYLKNEPNKKWWETIMNIGLTLMFIAFIVYMFRNGVDDDRPLWSYIVTTLLVAYYGFIYAFHFFRADEFRADRLRREAAKAEKKERVARYKAREAQEAAMRAERALQQD